MWIWIQLFLLPALALLSILFGNRFARSPRLWFVGFILPLSAIILIILGRRSTFLSFVPPISWAIHPFVEPLLMAVAIPLMLSTLISKLPHSRQRKSITCFMLAVTAYYAIFPCAAPLLARNSLAATHTIIDKDGICLQTHPYTCGPAAAVTCLRVLGIHADEGDLAIRAYTAPCIGTDGNSLADAINQLSEPAHLHCDYQWLNSPDHIPLPAIATIISPRYGGHYIALLEVTPDFIIVGDPLTGRDKLTRAEFLSEWTHATHTFTRLSHR